MKNKAFFVALGLSCSTTCAANASIVGIAFKRVGISARSEAGELISTAGRRARFDASQTALTIDGGDIARRSTLKGIGISARSEVGEPISTAGRRARFDASQTALAIGGGDVARRSTLKGIGISARSEVGEPISNAAHRPHALRRPSSQSAEAEVAKLHDEIAADPKLAARPRITSGP
jgi:hypothetical protein